MFFDPRCRNPAAPATFPPNGFCQLPKACQRLSGGAELSDLQFDKVPCYLFTGEGAVVVKAPRS